MFVPWTTKAEPGAVVGRRVERPEAREEEPGHRQPGVHRHRRRHAGEPGGRIDDRRVRRGVRTRDRAAHATRVVPADDAALARTGSPEVPVAKPVTCPEAFRKLAPPFAPVPTYPPPAAKNAVRRARAVGWVVAWPVASVPDHVVANERIRRRVVDRRRRSDRVGIEAQVTERPDVLVHRASDDGDPRAAFDRIRVVDGNPRDDPAEREPVLAAGRRQLHAGGVVGREDRTVPAGSIPPVWAGNASARSRR